MCTLALKEFFEQNQTELQKNYPGITLRRLKQDYELAADKQKFLKDVLQGRPLEYIIENSFFYRSDFYVDSRVLIPRSESEILVESLINIELEFKEKQISVCEIGVGSFALGLSYLIDSKKEVSFTGTDISEAALSVAHINKEKHRNKISGHKIKLVETDRLNDIDNEFHIIFTNPPYIKESQIIDVHLQTQKYEPHIALFLSDENYSQWFDKLFSQVNSQLKKQGHFIMEGHEDNLEQLRDLAQQYFYDVKLIKDYTDRYRFLTGRK